MSGGPVRALILAAGTGMRLGGGSLPPKSLLRFGGSSLLARHLEILFDLGVEEVVVGVGYRSDDIRREIASLGYGDRVGTVFNPDFEEGNVVTLWRLRGHLTRGGSTLLMDADVLYERAVMERLVRSEHASCFLYDRDFEPGDEPVKLCLRDGRPVEFGKVIPGGTRFDEQGESVGFFKLSQAAGARLAARAAAFLDAGRRDAFYEDALRELVLEDGAAFGTEDITGHAWIEIDFHADVERAEREVLPRILAVEPV